MQKKPKCTCGQCNVCKTRERMRKARAEAKGVSVSRRFVESGGPDAKALTRHSSDRPAKLPAQERELVQLPDNLAIWVDGNGHSYGSDTLKGRIYEAESDLDDEIRALQDQVNSFSKKPRRNGKEYWYQWVNRDWKYVGPVDAKHDPRTALEERIEARRERKRKAKELMKSCVIKELGKHLLIDIEKFRAHVDKKLPGNIIKVSEILGAGKRD